MTAALMYETGKPKKRSERPLFHYFFEVAQVWSLGTFDVTGVVSSFLNRKIRMLLIRGHRKNCREGVTKNPDRVGVKIWLQGGRQLHGTGRENFQKNDRNF